MLDSTTYPLPRYPAIVRALAGDSTMTSRRAPLRSAAPCLPTAPFAALSVLAGTLFTSSPVPFTGSRQAHRLPLVQLPPRHRMFPAAGQGLLAGGPEFRRTDWSAPSPATHITLM